MRILFAGTPGIAVPCLQALVASSYDVEVLTSPDVFQGRGRKFAVSPIKERAIDLGLVVHQFERLDDQARQIVQDRQLDLLVCFSYGRIFGPLFLGLFPLGGLNVHPSLLPRWRGPSPLAAVILANDAETGLTVQRLALEVDSGDIVKQSRIPLKGSESAESLTAWAANEAPSILLQSIDDVVRTHGLGPFIPQDKNQATYCKFIAKEDACIDWCLSAAEIERRIRAYKPWPGAYTDYRGQRLIIWEAHVFPERLEHRDYLPGIVIALDRSQGILIKTGQGLLALRRLQLQSKKSLDFQAFAHGARRLFSCCLGGST